LVEDIHEEARKVVLVRDNLNIHGPGCLYEAFEPARARRIAEKLEWHYTPKHGSWLNMAEIELAA
jgi:transposase